MHFKALHNIQIGLYSFLSAYYSTYKKEALMPFFCVDMNTFCERYCIFKVMFALDKNAIPLHLKLNLSSKTIWNHIKTSKFGFITMRLK